MNSSWAEFFLRLFQNLKKKNDEKVIIFYLFSVLHIYYVIFLIILFLSGICKSVFAFRSSWYLFKTLILDELGHSEHFFL